MPLDANKMAELDALYGAPTGLHPDKIAQLDSIYGAPDDGFSSRLGKDYDKRITQMEGIADQNFEGKIGKTEALARQGLKYAQLLPDAASEVITSGWRSLPDTITDPLRKGAQHVGANLADTPAGDLARLAVQKYNDYAQENPVNASRLGSVVDTGNLLAPFARVGGKSVADAAVGTATDAAKLAGQGAKKVGSAAVGVITPGIDSGLMDVASLARQHNIPVSFDQVSGSRALKNVQKISQEVPLSGQAGFRENQMRAFNRALFKTVGVEADMFTPASMNQAFAKVGGEFDAITKGKNFSIGGDFVDNLAKSADEVESLYGKEAAGIFQKEASRVMNDFQGDAISGDLISRQRARINGLARKAGPGQKEALLELENNIVDGITGGDDVAQAALSQAKQRYKNLIVLEPIANKARGGKISPSLLNNRVSQVYRRAHTIGESGAIGDLARVGHELLPELGGSDTTQKMAYIAALTTGSVNPASAAPIAAGAAANRVFQSGINRNQGLIDKALMKQIMKLPPAQAKAALEKLKAQ